MARTMLSAAVALDAAYSSLLEAIRAADHEIQSHDLAGFSHHRRDENGDLPEGHGWADCPTCQGVGTVPVDEDERYGRACPDCHGGRINLCEERDCMGEDPHDTLLVVLDQVRAEIIRHRDHRHEWNDDHRCTVCGADGLV